MPALAVPADSANWTSSGVSVQAGDVLDITASGAIAYYGGGGLNVKPTGLGMPDTGYYVAQHLRQYALVGMISATTPPRVPEDRVNDRDQSLPMFAVGDGLRLTAERDGTLYFVVNDTMFRDNRGHFDVTITPLMSVRCEGIEVVQAVQDRTRSMPLIRGKQTTVRVYVSASNPSAWKAYSSESIVGKLQLSRGSGAIDTLVPTGSLRVADLPSAGSLDLLDGPRSSLARSLNFAVPDAAAKEPTLTVALTGCTLADGSVVIPVLGDTTLKVTTEEAPPLRVRVIGLRYLSAAKRTVQPRETDYKHLRSWLRRAFPVASVDFTSFVTDAQPGMTLPFTAQVDQPGAAIDEAIAQVAALRALDMAHSRVDQSTHYCGFVFDERVYAEGVDPTFIRGKAMDVPAEADPTVISAGACGVPLGTNTTKVQPNPAQWGYWNDKDASYGDFYGAHEIAHSLGRAHVHVDDETDIDLKYPVKETEDQGAYAGRIGSPTTPDVGFDVGDAELGIMPRVLPYASTYEVMTYQDACWVSGYTSRGILKRLRDEETALSRPRTDLRSCAFGRFLHVVVVQSSDTVSRFAFVTPVDRAANRVSGKALAAGSALGDAPEIRVTITGTAGTRLVAYAVRRRTYFFGVDAALALDLADGEKVTKLEYCEKKTVCATRAIAANATGVTGVRVTPVPGSTSSVTVAWSSTGGSPTYAVQVSQRSDRAQGGWATIAVGLTGTSFTVEKDWNWDTTFMAWNEAFFRVLATNGVDTIVSAPVALATIA